MHVDAAMCTCSQLHPYLAVVHMLLMEQYTVEVKLGPWLGGSVGLWQSQKALRQNMTSLQGPGTQAKEVSNDQHWHSTAGAAGPKADFHLGSLFHTSP